jgi:hypothetical protein
MPDNKTATEDISPEVVAQFLRTLTAKANEPKDIPALYANNTTFEVSAWDLKIFFGQLDQRSGGNIDWHTAMTIPWTQARVLEYFLKLNTIFYETKFARITLPPQLVPAPHPRPTEEQIKSDPQAIELWEAYLKVHAEMFGSPELPHAPSEPKHARKIILDEEK